MKRVASPTKVPTNRWFSPVATCKVHPISSSSRGKLNGFTPVYNFSTIKEQTHNDFDFGEIRIQFPDSTIY